MRKKILIISSENTGHGHKSITESLCEKIILDTNVDIHVVDGFSLGGRLLSTIGNSYGPITRSAEKLWEIIWKLTAIKASLVNTYIEAAIQKNFLQLIKDIEPDVIVSVHPNFNGSILNILEKERLDIPFLTLIADLVNIYPLWADKRANCIISPTSEARDKCLEYGIPKEKIVISGFPVRSRFFASNRNLLEVKESHSPLTCLIMSGGEGSGNMKTIAENLLNNFDCRVKIVAGRNAKLKANLEESLRQYEDKVEIYGFTKDIQDLMFDSDIAFTRGSPNVMFEAIASNTPLIITGALPGQEEDNPAFVEKRNLGVICKDTDHIKQVIGELLENDAQKLNNIKQSQQAFINREAAEDIVRIILQTRSSYQYSESISQISASTIHS
ncbi:MGDG synthase family glycosyltransferase [Bacillus suaedae]|uniref:Glycosyltransferase n=1 Tax=Halalkalibacter suaedae TaxID=2822140 RepID=A0A940WV68_9BACI|nr:glycosyltransferase [Bacillus suaedae]MBP3952876.1 glycosyltransferase [Bacillus suaedae]